LVYLLGVAHFYVVRHWKMHVHVSYSAHVGSAPLMSICLNSNKRIEPNSQDTRPTTPLRPTTAPAHVHCYFVHIISIWIPRPQPTHMAPPNHRGLHPTNPYLFTPRILSRRSRPLTTNPPAVWRYRASHARRQPTRARPLPTSPTHARSGEQDSRVAAAVTARGLERRAGELGAKSGAGRLGDDKDAAFRAPSSPRFAASATTSSSTSRTTLATAATVDSCALTTVAVVDSCAVTTSELR
jgi:hypothetical protein